jgi:hypothetical protein
VLGRRLGLHNTPLRISLLIGGAPGEIKECYVRATPLSSTYLLLAQLHSVGLVGINSHYIDAWHQFIDHSMKLVLVPLKSLQILSTHIQAFLNVGKQIFLIPRLSVFPRFLKIG